MLSSLRNIYEKEYKRLLIIPVVMLIVSLILIGVQVSTTGDFINKEVSLAGGVTITLQQVSAVPTDLEAKLKAAFPSNDIDVRTLRSAGVDSAIVVTADIQGTNEIDSFIASLESATGEPLNDYNVEVIGSSLGASFFKEVLIALIVAFVLMGIVVLIYFRILIPSLAAIFSVFTDIVITLAIVNLIGIKVNTAGIAAFLMLIGYSVDTDILLSMKLLKRREGRSIFEATLDAMKTGLMMSITTILALIVALVFSQSATIQQIATILLIGVIVDIIATWITNAALLRMYLERKLHHEN